VVAGLPPTDRQRRDPASARGGFATRAIHRARAPEVNQQPSSVPLYQTSTWRFGSTREYAKAFEDEGLGYVYGRGYGNPTVDAFEAVMASLEETEAAYGFSSGMAAIHAVAVALASPGDRVVASRELYGGTYTLFMRLLYSIGVRVELVDVRDAAAVAAAVRGAAFFYTETIANPTCAVTDLEAVAALCHGEGVPVVVDATFASPYLCTPSRLGVDYVIHSATKYLGGHSDLVAGVVCASSSARKDLRDVTLQVGGSIAPFEAWLCIRGIETLALRMEQHCRSALALAEALAVNDRVSAVHYPGLASHPDHATAVRQFRDGCFGGMVAFEVAGGVDEVASVCDRLQVAWLGVSLGGPHTLVTHPASTTHRQLDAAAREVAGLADGLVRVSVGLEDQADLLEDFEQALAARP
jgi:methionine-gamma-lyase